MLTLKWALLVSLLIVQTPEAFAGRKKAAECPEAPELSKEDCQRLSDWAEQIVITTTDLCQLAGGGKFPKNIDDWATFLADQYCKNKVSPPPAKFGCKVIAKKLIKKKLTEMGSSLSNLKCKMDAPPSGPSDRLP